MKLQKLVYYVKVWTIVAQYPHIVDDAGNLIPFKKWKHGPVNQDLYDEYKHYRGKVIKVQIEEAPEFHPKDGEVVDFILENYVDYTAVDLSIMTHNESPWMETSDSKTISKQLIERYYSQQPFAKNFIDFDPQNNPFYMLQDQVWYAFTMDMSNYDKELSVKLPSYDEFKRLKRQATEAMGIMER